jgi:hypothetical protein
MRWDQNMMDANELRALQAPLKKQYREQPETARTPARAAATLELGEIGCRLRSWGGETKAGLLLRPAGTGPWHAPPTCCWRRWSPVPA